MFEGSGEYCENVFGAGEPLLHPALSGFWEIEQGEGQITNVQGRLRRSLNFWLDELDPAPWIIDCINDGYKLPLRTIPDM